MMTRVQDGNPTSLQQTEWMEHRKARNHGNARNDFRLHMSPKQGRER